MIIEQLFSLHASVKLRSLTSYSINEYCIAFLPNAHLRVCLHLD